MKNHLDDLAVVLARVLIAALFVAGTVQKAINPEPTVALLAAQGWPVWMVWPALLFNGAIALALLMGVALRPVGFAAAGYCALTSLFHYIPDDPWQMSIFVKNWAIAGGCLVLAVHGGGRYVLQGRAGQASNGTG